MSANAGKSLAGTLTVDDGTGTSGAVPPFDASSQLFVGIPVPKINTPVAAAGSGSGTAASVGPGITRVTGADATAGVTLTAAGTLFLVKNDEAANAVLKVYPPAGGKINNGSANAALSMAAKTSAVFVQDTAGVVFTLPLLPS